MAGEDLAAAAVSDAGPAPLGRTPGLSRLGQYQILAKLGQGGMAQVYLGVSRGDIEDFRKLVVLKVLHENLRDDPTFVKMFMKEATIAARLAHPNVVHTYTVGEEDGHYCIVMEYLEGASLSAFLKRVSDDSFDDRIKLLRGVSSALAGLHYVHDFRDYDGSLLELVHRDVKPGNIFITFDGQVKVLDFGVAKMTAVDQATASQVVKGTVHYMAPEALEASATIDRRFDIFAAGLVLWEVAHGQRVWGDLTNLQILRSLADGKLPQLSGRLAQQVPAELTQICEKAIAPNRDDRYSTALELKRELDRFLRNYDVDDQGLVELSDKLFSDLRRRRTKTIQERLKLIEEHSTAAPLPTLLTSPSSTFISDSDTMSDQRSALTGVRPIVSVVAGGVGLLAVAGVAAAVAIVMTRQPQNNAPTAPAAVAAVANGAEQPSSPAAPETNAASPSDDKGSDESAPANVAVAAAGREASQDNTEPSVFEVKVHVSPEGAEVRLDDELQEERPISIAGGKDDVHVLVASAPGYEDEELRVQTDQSREIHLNLSKEQRSSRRRRRPIKRSPPPSPTPESKPEPVAEASPPAAEERRAPRPGDEMKRAGKRKRPGLDKTNPFE